MRPLDSVTAWPHDDRSMMGSHWNVLKAGGKAPQLPDGLRVYAIGDIHGRLDLLASLLRKIKTDRAVRPVVRSVYIFLGDYIDRGPASCQTIDRLIQLADDTECVFLRGNHEQLAIRCLTDVSCLDQWMRLGGDATLRSYSVDLLPFSRESLAQMQAALYDAISERHLGFFRNLENSFTCGDFFFVHAGIRPHITLGQQSVADLLWIRDEFLSCPLDFGKIIVHGHTPTHTVDVQNNRINVDTGAFATGCLSCLVLDQGSLSVIDTHDDGAISR